MPKNNYKKVLKLLIFGIGIFLLLPNFVLAAPSVSGVTGSVSHGETVTISGLEFGVKNPAKPLMWDNCEDATIGAFPPSSANSSSQVGYSDYQPRDTKEGYDIPESYEMRYRSISYAPVAVAVNAPHNRSTKYLVGGHWDPGLNNGDVPARDVDLTVATPADFSSNWFATWYYRTDPDWPTPCLSGQNEKVSVYQAGIQAYSNSPYSNQYHYFDLLDKSCTGNSYITMKVMSADSASIGNAFVTSGTYIGSLPQTSTPWNYNMGFANNRRAHSQKDQWVRYEQQISNNLGFVRFLIDNYDVWYGVNQPNFFTDANEMGYAGIRSYTLGGYFRYTSVPTNQTHNNAFRYFDDIYVDNTLARVMLCNHEMLLRDGTDICEPQIPTAWHDESIVVEANLGKLPDAGTAYLYVVNENGDVNASGYPITIGEGSTDVIAPTAPSGLNVL